MRGLNKVTLIGNLGKDPELQHLEGAISVAKFSLAITKSYKDRNGQTLAICNCAFCIVLGRLEILRLDN